jgi:hypothetical protein
MNRAQKSDQTMKTLFSGGLVFDCVISFVLNRSQQS